VPGWRGGAGQARTQGREQIDVGAHARCVLRLQVGGACPSPAVSTPWETCRVGGTGAARRRRRRERRSG
jgi:hypothetical protein